MPLSVDDLRQHVAYSAWASQRLVHAASELAPDDLARDFQTADRSVLGTLVHTFAADRVWLARLQKLPQLKYSSEADYHLHVLQEEWPAVYRQWDTLLSGLTEDGVRADLEYRDMKGNAWTQSIWKIVLHVVNHASHHRGQVSGFLRTMGHTPPVLDLIAFYRSQG